MRRMGKSFILSMVYHFFNNNHPDNIARNRALFNDTLIGMDKMFCEQHQGQYLVIFITLKNIAVSNYKDSVAGLRDLIIVTYKYHRYLLASDLFAEDEKIEIRKYMDDELNSAELIGSLKRLSHFLAKHYSKKVLILIDEYDAPFNRFFGCLLKLKMKNSENPFESFLMT